MGLTGLAVALAISYLGNGRAGIPVFLFLSHWIHCCNRGRAQLFTENTLFPVVLILERKRILNTLRLWVAVFVANIAGAVFFGWLVMKTGALSPNFADALAGLGLRWSADIHTHFCQRDYRWLADCAGSLDGHRQPLDHRTNHGYVDAAFVVGAGHFSHCIASGAEIVAAIMAGHLHFQQLFSMAATGDAGKYWWRRLRHCEPSELRASQRR